MYSDSDFTSDTEEIYNGINRLDYPLEIYTDGSSLNNGSSDAKAGWAVSWAEVGYEDRDRSGPVYQGKQTSNRAELYALNTALNQILHYRESHYHIYADSEYSLKAIGEWADKWERNGWVNSQGKKVKNCGLIKSIRLKIAKAFRAEIRIDFKHVPAHSGNPGNEYTDKMAKNAANGYYVNTS